MNADASYREHYEKLLKTEVALAGFDPKTLTKDVAQASINLISEQLDTLIKRQNVLIKWLGFERNFPEMSVSE